MSVAKQLLEPEFRFVEGSVYHIIFNVLHMIRQTFIEVFVILIIRYSLNLKSSGLFGAHSPATHL